MVQRYVNAANLTDAIQILAKEKGSARIIAGATDLMLEIERGTRKGIETLVDISRAKETNFITLDESGWIHLGPTVTHNQAASSKLIHEYGLPLALACWSVGSPQIRNRGTVAGNLVTASPANDTIPALTVLQAEISLASSRGIRKIKLSDFYTGVRKTVLAEDELVSDIAFPCLIPNQRGVFVKSALRKAQAISVVNAALVLEMENEIISNAIIALGAVAPTIIRASSCEKKLIGQKISYKVIEEASREVEKDIRPISDLRGSDGGRHQFGQQKRFLSGSASGTLCVEAPDRYRSGYGNHGRFKKVSSRAGTQRSDCDGENAPGASSPRRGGSHPTAALIRSGCNHQ